MAVHNELSAETLREGVDPLDLVPGSLSEDAVATQHAANCSCRHQSTGVCRTGVPLGDWRVRVPHNRIQLGYGCTLRRQVTLIRTSQEVLKLRFQHFEAACLADDIGPRLSRMRPLIAEYDCFGRQSAWPLVEGRASRKLWGFRGQSPSLQCGRGACMEEVFAH